MSQGFFTFTMDSIMKVFFGEDSDTVMGKENKYGEAFDKAQSAMRRHMIKSLSFHLISRTFLPWPFGGSTGQRRVSDVSESLPFPHACRNMRVQHAGIARILWDTLSPTHREFLAERRIINAEADRCLAWSIMDREASQSSRHFREARSQHMWISGLVQDCLADPQFENRRDLLALLLRGIYLAEIWCVCEALKLFRYSTESQRFVGSSAGFFRRRRNRSSRQSL